MDKKVIEFLRKKDYRFIDDIGQGGTGKTVLLKDEIIDEIFVCKKYSPYYDGDIDLYFGNFVDEIKILHKIYHKNIVRVFNYYLYPEKTTGYILMEFINGQDLKTFSFENPHLINDLFEQTISGFAYLEQNNILHRDIRPENILVSTEGFVKIIDFGFGKRINFTENYNKSITLNWRYHPPDEFNNKTYDFRTEVYFVGKLFEEILRECKIENFSHIGILSEMIKVNFTERISNFSLIERNILSNESIGIEFTPEQKEIYREFAKSLNSIFSSIEDSSKYITDIEKILINLEDAYSRSMLEEYIQNSGIIARCFVIGSFRYYKKDKFPVYCLKDFIGLIKSVSIDKKRIIVNNLWQRLDAINRHPIDLEELPF